MKSGLLAVLTLWGIYFSMNSYLSLCMAAQPSPLPTPVSTPTPAPSLIPPSLIDTPLQPSAQPEPTPILLTSPILPSASSPSSSISSSPLPSPAASPSISQAMVSPSTPISLADWVFDHIENDILYFKTKYGQPIRQRLKTHLFQLNYIGTLRSSDDSLPYFLLSGKPCQNCLTETAIYAIRPSNEKPASFVFPGKLMDPKNHTLVYESRAFYGKCLPNKGDLYIVFQKEKIDRKRYHQSSVLLAEAAQDHLQEQLFERRLPSLKNTLQRVKKGQCHEIIGRNRMILNAPLDIHLKSDSDELSETLDNA